jgi:hypothetical protein
MKKRVLLFILILIFSAGCFSIQPDKIDTSKYLVLFYKDLSENKIKLYDKPLSSDNAVLTSISLKYYIYGRSSETWFNVQFLNPITPQEKEDMGNLKVLSADIVYKSPDNIVVYPVIGVPL